MTVVLSIATDSMITLSVDSALVREFPDRREYDTTQKAWAFPGVGCVATWGTPTGNNIGQFLQSQGIGPSKHSVDDLAQLVDDYLRKEYRPHEGPLDDVGYHVAGFDQQGKPRLYHVVWGIERPAPQGHPNPQKYHWSRHHPQPGKRVFLYNGRNGLVQMVINVLWDEVQSGRDTNFDLNKAVDQIRFADFVLRFVAELTPQVAPPFKTFVLTPEKRLESVVNPKLERILLGDVENILRKLGIST